jgi:LytS/YehU family sensor histidine kinase
LIDENEPAQQYLSRLSDVYRYVLVSKDRNTVTLREEMEFVNAFLYLAKVRFTTGLTIEKDIPDSVLEQLVAPLSVQLLVENALKHNVITRENPLTISILVENNFLWVKNEIKPKVHFESGTKVGLNNIMERYRLLTSMPVKILKEANRFEVGLPLMVG